MVVVWCEEDIVEFCWIDQDPRESYIIEEPQSFSYEEEADYIPIYMQLDPEDLPMEIGTFLDGECKGATVVQDTSAQICAYILESQGGSLEFEFYYGGRAENKVIREYYVYDPETSRTEKGSIQVENNKDCYYVSFKDEPASKPEPVKLEASNYPNPFNPITTISYSLPDESEVSLTIYNIKGQKVKELIKGTQPAGSYNVSWDGKDENGKDITSGIYFYKLRTHNNEITRKMLLLK
ncbi:MAG: T9SS type A sorting domain-containing protein [Candidatus Cloacimonetes bacterium]|nr:T9SS type A sorting domain-containing protein [Candidatus Cloacimonadota bacterium]